MIGAFSHKDTPRAKIEYSGQRLAQADLGLQTWACQADLGLWTVIGPRRLGLADLGLPSRLGLVGGDKEGAFAQAVQARPRDISIPITKEGIWPPRDRLFQTLH